MLENAGNFVYVYKLIIFKAHSLQWNGVNMSVLSQFLDMTIKKRCPCEDKNNWNIDMWNYDAKIF